MVSVTNPSDTRLLNITVTSEDPVEATNMANEYASVACDYIYQVMGTEEPRLFSEALQPTSPVSPNKTRNTIPVSYTHLDVYKRQVHTQPSSCGLFDFFRSAILRGGIRPAVAASSILKEGPETIVDAMRFCTEMERGRAARAIKPDVCLNQIPGEILRAALVDGGVLRHFPGWSERQIGAKMEEFFYYHSQRFHNAFAGEQPRMQIMSCLLYTSEKGTEKRSSSSGCVPTATFMRAAPKKRAKATSRAAQRRRHRCVRHHASSDMAARTKSTPCGRRPSRARSAPRP